MAALPRRPTVRTGSVGDRMIHFLEMLPFDVGLYVTSGNDGDHGASSHHYGLSWNGSPTAAIDIGAYDDPEPKDKDQRDMRDFARYIVQHFGDLCVELIHTTPYNDDDGFYIRKGKRFAYDAPTRTAHLNHVHIAMSSASVDSAIRRARSMGLGPNTSPPVHLPPSNGAEPLWGWDGSDYDWNRGARPVHVRNFVREGGDFLTWKISEVAGNGIHNHDSFAPMLTAGRDAGLKFLGGYVVVRTPGRSVETQVDHAIGRVRALAPWLLEWPDFFWQIDLEVWAEDGVVYDDVAPSYGAEMVNLFEGKTGLSTVLYASKGQYNGRFGGEYTVPRWNANYNGSGAARFFKEMYVGNDHEGWKSYNGATPTILQFASDAVVGTQHNCDINAFRGSEADFRKQISRRVQTKSGQTASIYGVLDDGRLTYTEINSATGARTYGAVTSTTSLGFTPKAMATLDSNTILINSTSGSLYRIDVSTNKPSLTFNTPALLGEGWNHDRLAYDGNGYLFGIAAGTLHRYAITAAKPAIGEISGNTVIDSGFSLETLTTTGPGWILGTTRDGKLLSYRIEGAKNWKRYELKSSTWQVFDSLISPGGGVYFGHKSNGSMFRYLDDDPFDGNGTGLTGKGTVDTSGWTQVLLSAQPGTVI